MATSRRVYKLQEFVAHSATVNCLKIGRKTSRLLATGGEDNKVNLWSIGKPNAILSLSGHMSPIESVSFDSSEVMVAAGAASGTIKLWDLEEAKIVRTFSGHRSNCISVDFHPFGEFFASGSLDTYLKIWDIRKKSCIHTYKGHTRGVNAIRFTPDGRWVVSGGEDNIVKIWDLTAGKLLHDFKFHEGQIQCLDFHPHEFLLATGSADRMVKFWDLETFELIGSSVPENSGVCSMTFNPDGRTLLCGLRESLKVFSWEPVRCHDGVDVGWSRLSDMNIHEGKLLGCSYNQSCVGVWVVDISQVEPYVNASVLRSNGNSEPKSITSYSPMQDEIVTISKGRLSASENSKPVSRETRPVSSTRTAAGTPGSGLSSGSKVGPTNSSTVDINLKRNSKPPGTGNLQTPDKSDMESVISTSTSSRSELTTDSGRETISSTYSSKERISFTDSRKSITDGRESPSKASRRSSSRGEASSDYRKESTDGRVSTPVVLSPRPQASDARKGRNDTMLMSTIPRTNPRSDESSGSVRESIHASGSRNEAVGRRKSPNITQTKLFYILGSAYSRDDKNRGNLSSPCVSTSRSALESSDPVDRNVFSDAKDVNQALEPSAISGTDIIGAGTRKIESNLFEDPHSLGGREINGFTSHKPREASSLNNPKGIIGVDPRKGGRLRSSFFKGPTSGVPRTMAPANSSYALTRETESASDEVSITDLMEQHEQFLNTAQSRIKKLQVVRRLWERNDIRGVINVADNMCDHAVSADIVSALMGKSDMVTLDICVCLFPLLSRLLESMIDRHLVISLDMLLRLVRTFGPVIHSTISSAPSIGVDLQAEHRLERCNLCFIELEKAKNHIPTLLRRGGSVAKSAQELNLALQEVL